MNLYQAVKANVTARQAAEHLGLQVGRNGMACCPFHPDKHPSMKLDERYYCFGCQETGDAIDFAARYLNVSPRAAAERLAQTFGVTYDTPIKGGGKPSRPPPLSLEQRKARLTVKAQRAFKYWREESIDMLTAHQKLLEEKLPMLEPKPCDAPWSAAFIAAIKAHARNDILLDILKFGSTQSQIELCLTQRERIAAIGKQLEEYRREQTERIGGRAVAGRCAEGASATQ